MEFRMLESLLNNTEGRWISQRTTYYFNKKKIRNNQVNIEVEQVEDKTYKNFSKHKNKISYLYKYVLFDIKSTTYDFITDIEDVNKNGIINKTKIDSKQKYKFMLKNNLFKIQYVNNIFDYLEYIYFVNSKFKISIIILKKNNSYIAISFNSEIKMQSKYN